MAAECILKLRGITDCISFNDREDLHAVLSREGFLKKTLHSVWGCPGHVFLSLDGGTMVKDYQLKTSMPIKQFSIIAKTSPVVQLCFAEDSCRLILAIHQNGLVKVYESFEPEDSNTQPWRKRAQFSLGTPTRNASINSALYSSKHANRLVWVEKTKEDTLCCSLFTAELEPNFMNIRSPVLLLSDCPGSLMIAATQNGDITILPSQPSPPGLYFRFHCTTQDNSIELATSIMGQGCVQRDNVFPVDFKDNADKLTHLWSKVDGKPSHVLVSMAMEAGTGDLWVISEDGTVHSISAMGEERTDVFHIPDVDPVAASWFAHRHVLGAVFQQEQVIRVYSTTSGRFLQQVSLPSNMSDKAIHTWCMLGNVPQIGVWSEDGIWLLQIEDVHATALSAAEPITNLERFGLDKMAASAELQRAHSQLSSSEGPAETRGAEGCECNLRLVEDGKVFQNEALMVALLQSVHGSDESELAHKLKDVEEAFEKERKESPETSLNELMGPLLQDFWLIQGQRDQALKDEVPSSGGSTISSEVHSALQQASPIPLDLRLDRLELLSQLYPEVLLDCLMKEFSLYKILESETDASPADCDGEDRSPLQATLCHPETEAGCRLLKLLGRLTFIYQPTKLVALVDYFQGCHQTASDASAFTRKRSLSIESVVLETLPDPSDSVDVKMAAKAKAQLLQRSGKDQASVRALQLLLRHSLWVEGIRAVESFPHTDSQCHRELFHALLSALLRDPAAFQLHSQKLWACLPPAVSALSLLQTLQINQDRVQSQISLRDTSRQPASGQALTTALLKEQLIEMLAHGTL